MVEKESLDNPAELAQLRASTEAVGKPAGALQEPSNPPTEGSPSAEAVEVLLKATAFLAERACVYALGSEPGTWTLIGQRGHPQDALQVSYRPGEGLVARAGESGTLEAAPLPTKATALALPIKLAENPVAVLHLDRGSGSAFTPGDLAAARALAFLAGSLFHMEQVRLASQESVVQAERNRIAREIHDGVSQNLALLILKMEIISRLSESDPGRAKVELGKVMSILEASIHELRRSIHALRSPDLPRQ